MVAVAGGSAIAPRPLVRTFIVIGAICAVVPDIDAIGRPFHGGAGDIAWLGGHRGFTHSIPFALLLGVVVACLTLWKSSFDGHRVRLTVFVAFSTASHGALDFYTSIGARTSPVQFWSPFSDRGYTAVSHPINGPFSELFLILIPLLLLTRLVWHLRGIHWQWRRDVAPVVLNLRS
jgi:inner membrane protein